jgi:dipeptidase
LKILLIYLSIIGLSLQCTNILVSRNASADGNPMIAYTADSGSLYGEVKFLPATDYPE